MDGTEKTPKKEATVKIDSASKASRKSAKVKESKPKKVNVPMVVFAFRLTKEQRDAIHKAAGPGKATQFVRDAALAAASTK